MDKIFLEKERLVLAYGRNLQLLSVVLFSGLGAIFTYIGALVINLERLFEYTFIIIIASAFIRFLYIRIDNNLREISEEIKNITLSEIL